MSYTRQRVLLDEVRGPGPGDEMILAVMKSDAEALRRWVTEAVESGRTGFHAVSGRIAEYTDDIGAADQVARIGLSAGAPVTDRVGARIDLARLLVARGRWREAAAELDLASELDPLSASLERATLASLPFLRVPPDDLARSRAELRAWAPAAPGVDTPAEAAYEPHKRLSLLGLLSSKLGESDQAGAYADSIESIPDPAETAVPAGLAAGVRGDVAWRSGRPAAEVLQELEPGRGHVPAGAWRDAVLGQEHARYVRVHAYRLMSRDEEALAWLSDSFTGTPGWHYYKAPVRYLSAAVLEALGRPDEAAEAREGFERLWSRADPEVAEALREEAER